jgi:hypothetical protein
MRLFYGMIIVAVYNGFHRKMLLVLSVFSAKKERRFLKLGQLIEELDAHATTL